VNNMESYANWLSLTVIEAAVLSQAMQIMYSEELWISGGVIHAFSIVHFLLFLLKL